MRPGERPFRCAEAALERGDPLAGSAPPARRWLLLEHPGPWPVDAVAGSGIEPTVLALLTRRARLAGVRILLVRRPGRQPRLAERRWLLAGLDRPTVGGPWSDDQDLLRAATALDQFPSGGADDEPAIMLVCTHGVHDACCAIRGRPVAAALAEAWPGQVWECSHVGGDRFAPNVVLLPDGFYYGALTPDAAVETVRRHLAGAVDAGALRGLARFEPPVQAAAVAVFDRLGPLPAESVRLVARERVGPHDGHGSETAVQFRVPGGGVAVRVRAVRRDPARLTCRAVRATPATEYQILSLEELRD